MNDINSTGISAGIYINRRDYFRLPPDMRMVGDCAMVMTMINGRKTFVPAIIVE